MKLSFFQRFMHSEHAGGVILIAATVLAMLLANSGLAPAYHEFLNTKFAVGVDGFALKLSTGHWINDGLMVLFFLVVGLEIKREFLKGELASLDKAALPIICAAGGVIMPALIFILINKTYPENYAGWAIPTATDIAFALGLLALGGKHVPLSLKVFLTALAIIDDLIAILIIALFYGGAINIDMLLVGVAILFMLAGLNILKVRVLWPYLLLGFALWLAVLHSGLHATLAGVALAIFIPLGDDEEKSLLHKLEHALHPVSAFLIIPLFALANAGVSFTGLSFADFIAPLPLGIAVALFVGKQIGIYYIARLAVYMKWARMPDDVTRTQFYAVSCLAGVGFTMSLFIGTLAFESADVQNAVRLGVIGGSLLSGITGLALLRYGGVRRP